MRRSSSEYSQEDEAVSVSTEGGRKALILFLLTLFSVYASYGFFNVGGNPFIEAEVARRSAAFAGSLMSILLAHEMGHFIVARMHGFRLSLPYFIPVPFGFGTLGAVIRLKSLPRDRTALLEMGAAGPLAGAVVAFFCLSVGLGWSTEIGDPGPGIVILADPLILKLIALLSGRGALDPLTILHPMAEAGWVGCLITSINLVPIGQLDGGHVLGALWPRKARLRSLVVLVLAAMGGFFWLGWSVWAVVILALGAWRNLPVPARPPPTNRSRLIALAVLGVFLLCFMPIPIQIPEVQEAQPSTSAPMEAEPIDTAYETGEAREGD